VFIIPAITPPCGEPRLGAASGESAPLKRLGRATDSAEVQSELARAIYHDHLLALARMSVVLALQLVAG
jgi:hypothetical protein